MRVTMSCDHRVIDGATGAKFLQAVKIACSRIPLLLSDLNHSREQDMASFDVIFIGGGPAGYVGRNSRRPARNDCRGDRARRTRRNVRAVGMHPGQGTPRVGVARAEGEEGQRVWRERRRNHLRLRRRDEAVARGEHAELQGCRVFFSRSTRSRTSREPRSSPERTQCR